MAGSRFERLTSANKLLRLDPDLIRHGQKIRLVRLKKGQQPGKQGSFSCPTTELVRPNSGHVEEPLRSPFVGQGRGECGECKGMRIIWRLRRHGLNSRS